MDMSYDYKGNKLTINNVPERCPECKALLSGDKEDFKDFTNETVYICEQCSEELYIEY